MNTYCRTRVDFEKNIISSAYASSSRGVLDEKIWYGFCIPNSGIRRVSSVLTSVISIVREITNKYGENGHPCLIPEPCGCEADLVLVSLTSKVGSV